VAAIKMTGNRDLAKDALQEVFLEIWHYRKTIVDVSHTERYLVKVLKTILIKKLKKEYFLSYVFPEESIASSEQNIEDQIISTDTDKEKTGKLKRALSNLTKRQKVILQLHFYEGLSYKEIAEKLCINHQSVNNLAFRTMLRLRSQMYSGLVLGCMILG
jgi:RNA polymerase sigma-70 factor (ECF subfamily)